MKHFEPFDRVLTRAGNSSIWTADFYDHPDNAYSEHWTIGGALVADTDILPYNDETKHLHNTVGEFVTWKPKKGEVIYVRDSDINPWIVRIFSHMEHSAYACLCDYTPLEAPDLSEHISKWHQAKPYKNPFKE